MPDQETQEEVRQFNAKLDAALSAEGVVDQALFLRFLDGYNYDAASTVTWVIVRMRVLLQRVAQGKTLSLFSPEINGYVAIATEYTFRAWVTKNFPGIRI
jgi:hypothetical protein